MLVTQQAAVACAQEFLSLSNDTCRYLLQHAQAIIQQRERIKRQAIEYKRLQQSKLIA